MRTCLDRRPLGVGGIRQPLRPNQSCDTGRRVHRVQVVIQTRGEDLAVVRRSKLVTAMLIGPIAVKAPVVGLTVPQLPSSLDASMSFTPGPATNSAASVVPSEVKT